MHKQSVIAILRRSINARLQRMASDTCIGRDCCGQAVIFCDGRWECVDIENQHSAHAAAVLGPNRLPAWGVCVPDIISQAVSLTVAAPVGYDGITVFASAAARWPAAWGYSSTGRARRSQCRGCGFEPRYLHQPIQPAPVAQLDRAAAS